MIKSQCGINVSICTIIIILNENLNVSKFVSEFCDLMRSKTAILLFRVREIRFALTRLPRIN